MGRTSVAPLAMSEHSFTGEKLSLLAIFAHPEDESFGPAGTLARYASEGVQVSLVTVTRGSMPSPEEIRLQQPSDPASGERERLCSCRTTGSGAAAFLTIDRRSCISSIRTLWKTISFALFAKLNLRSLSRSDPKVSQVTAIIK